MKVLAWPGAKLGAALARELACECSALELHRFPDGETRVRIATAVDGEQVVVAASLDHPDPKFLPLVFAADAARELGARHVLLAAPYLAYMRQDIRFRPGEAVSSKTFARLLSSSFDALVTVDPHLHRYKSLSEIYSVPSRAVSAAALVARWVARNVQSPLIVGPDAESEQWVAEVARLAGAPFIVMQKTREGDREVRVETSAHLAAARTAVLVDDIVSTGRTLVAAAEALREREIPEVIAVGVHALFDDEALAAMRAAGIARVITCDTVEHASNAITVVPALAQAIREMARG
jgi:ribose-phosphate pyrophosphokinase